MGIIDRFGATYSVKRPAAGTRLKGRWVPGANSTISIVASVQPMNHHESMLLPEGWRTRGTVKIYTATELKACVPENSTKGDLITYEGYDWEVHTVDLWNTIKDIPHYKCIAVKVEKDS